VPWLTPILAALSGLLLVLAFPPFHCEWAVWIAFIPALLGIHREGSLAAVAGPKRRLARIYGPGYLLGLIYFGGVFWWIGLVTLAGTILLVLYFGIYPALWLAYARRRWPRTPPYTSFGNLALAAELASLWTIFEWVRGWLFSGFGWDGLGVALYRNLPLVQSACLGGVLLLTWLIVLINVVGALTLIRFYHELRREQKMKAHLDFNLSLLLLACLFSYGFHRLWHHPAGHEPRQLRYALIQPDIPQLLDGEFPPAESMRRHVALTAQAAALRPELIVWPESPVGVDIVVDDGDRRALDDLMRAADFSLLAGSLDLTGGRVFNAAMLFAPRGGEMQVYDKNHLVPYGEYAPMADWFPVMRRLVPFEIDFSPGKKPEVLVMANGGARLLPLICFEDTLSGYGRQGAALHPDLLVNITNDGWFRTSPGAEQHLANALFRPVELDRPLLRCGNNGISAVIDATGRIVSELEIDGHAVGISGILSGEVGWYPAEETLYLRWGNWIVAFSAFILAMRLGAARLNRAPGST
jgi:apolipoprotein N-acyltransferase